MPETIPTKKPKKVIGVGLIAVSIAYLLNPTAGVFELLPDNLPIIGNIDEILAIGLILSSVKYLRSGIFKLPTR